jgi:gas vesicle protein
MNNNNVTGLVVCAAVGAAVGAGLALLYAPCSGRETREMLARKAELVKDRARNVVELGQQAIAVARGLDTPRSFSSGVSAPRAHSS